jgi:hypothetical protein
MTSSRFRRDLRATTGRCLSGLFLDLVFDRLAEPREDVLDKLGFIGEAQT